MNTRTWLTLASLLATAACSGGGSNPADASTKDGSTNDAAKPGKDAGVADAPVDDDAPTGDDASVPTVDPQCTVPTSGGTAGSCVTIDDASVFCNPITNLGCDGDAGEACDIDTSGNIGCFAPPPANTTALCGTCDDQNTACAPGNTCVPVSQTAGGCAHFCCDDTDCTPGHCDKTALASSSVGVCVK